MDPKKAFKVGDSVKVIESPEKKVSGSRFRGEIGVVSDVVDPTFSWVSFPDGRRKDIWNSELEPLTEGLSSEDLEYLHKSLGVE